MQKPTWKGVAVLALALSFGFAERTHAAGDTKLVEAIGGLSAAYVYQTYLNIGMIGDGVAKKSMDAATGKQLLGSVVGMIDPISKQLASLSTSDSLSDDDKKGIAEFKSIVELLRSEGTELQALMESGDQSHADKYDTARKQAWEKIKTILGIKE